MTTPNLYNTGGIPNFEEPRTLAEARTRIAELRLAVMSINDQIAYQQASDGVDPAWLRKAATSRRFKSFELERLENWLTENSGLNEILIRIVRSDYNDQEWDSIITEARAIANSVIQGGS